MAIFEERYCLSFEGSPQKDPFFFEDHFQILKRYILDAYDLFSKQTITSHVDYAAVINGYNSAQKSVATKDVKEFKKQISKSVKSLNKLVYDLELSLTQDD